MTASSFPATLALVVWILSANCKRDSAARGELRGDDDFARRTGFDEIVKNPICDCFVERALVPIGRQIKFQGLALDAKTAGHVIDIDPGEVGLAGYRTNRCEIIGFKMDPVSPAWRWIWERFEPRLRGGAGNLCFSSSEKREVGCFGFGH
jgi:hypothetical protein